MGQILPSVHMGNFNLVNELIFQLGYCSYGKFQVGYQDEQDAISQVSSGNWAGVFIGVNF